MNIAFCDRLPPTYNGKYDLAKGWPTWMVRIKEWCLKLADRIRRARKLAGMSQLQLAQALDVQRSTVANWEGADDITPGAGRLCQLASVLNVSFEWLATGRGEVGLPSYIHEVHAVEDLLVLEDPREIRLVMAWRGASSRVKLNLLEAAELHSSSSRHRIGNRRVG